MKSFRPVLMAVAVAVLGPVVQAADEVAEIRWRSSRGWSSRIGT